MYKRGITAEDSNGQRHTGRGWLAALHLDLLLEAFLFSLVTNETLLFLLTQRLFVQASLDWRLRCRKILFVASICRRHVHGVVHFDDWSRLRKSERIQFACNSRDSSLLTGLLLLLFL